MTKDGKIMISALAATLVLLLGGGGYLAWQQSRGQFSDCTTGQIGGGFDSLGGAFTLTNQDGQRVTDAEVFSKPSLLYFGYTFCPDVCPLDNLRNADATHLLAERGIEVQPVFVSVDPARDTPEVVKDFVENFGEGMIGLTGTPDEIAAAAKLWRIYFKVNDEEDKEFYLVDHMTTTFMVMPGHGTVALFGRDVEPEDMADRAACIVRNG